MTLVFELGVRQLNKRGEELCGDSVAVSSRPECTTVVVSDGLGSGVKACILSTLTARIARRMLDEGLPLSEVVETVSATLPICRVRKIAYSTFGIAQLFAGGQARVAAFDSPPPVFVRAGKAEKPEGARRRVSGKVIIEYEEPIQPYDWLVMVTDGVLNAGIGGAYPLGWGWENLARYLETHAHPDLSADELAQRLAAIVYELYEGRTGDDVTIVAIKARRKHVLALLAGPPTNQADDQTVVDRWLSVPGKHVVCGGTTANIVARRLGQGIQVDLSTATDEVPAVGVIPGVDLVTEGTLTLSRALEYIRAGVPAEELKLKPDGASRLVVMLLGADEIHLFVGGAINPAHQNPSLPRQLALKTQLVQSLANALREIGKEVYIEQY